MIKSAVMHKNVAIVVKAIFNSFFVAPCKIHIKKPFSSQRVLQFCLWVKYNIVVKHAHSTDGYKTTTKHSYS